MGERFVEEKPIVSVNFFTLEKKNNEKCKKGYDYTKDLIILQKPTTI